MIDPARIAVMAEPAAVPTETTNDIWATGILVAVAMVVLATFVDALVINQLVIPAEAVPKDESPVSTDPATVPVTADPAPTAIELRVILVVPVRADTAANPPDDNAPNDAEVIPVTADTVCPAKAAALASPNNDADIPLPMDAATKLPMT